jgi:rRNA small subunit aminocarboxypropyltransferase
MEIHAPGHILLEIDAPVISSADAARPLLILDSTWRLLPKMRACVCGEVLGRSLPPGLETAYPRHSKLAEDPTQGLASIEALYAALRLMGHRDDSLLEQYHWRQPFLQICDQVL